MPETTSPAPTAKQVIRSVCARFHISERKLRMKSNRKESAVPRHFAAYLLKNDVENLAAFTKDSKLSLGSIGEYLGPVGHPKHHSTILESIQKVDAWIKDPIQGPNTLRILAEIRALYPVNQDRKIDQAAAAERNAHEFLMSHINA